jgi:hypothetical protein
VLRRAKGSGYGGDGDAGGGGGRAERAERVGHDQLALYLQRL